MIGYITRGWTTYKGVAFCRKSGRWRASIRHKNRKYSLGRYSVEEDAARAYDARARELFGEFARLNFPGDE
jgi:hypothetical protein